MRKVEHLRISVSPECNLRCKHCYVPDQKEILLQDERTKLISAEDTMNFMDNLLANYGLRKITLSGGEPLLSTIWYKTKVLLKYACDHDLEVQFNTNGCGNVSIEEINSIVEDKKHLIFFHVSLDGCDADYVDDFRGCKGTFKEVLKFLEIANANGYATRIRYTATCKNLNQVIPCYEIAQRMGLDAFLIKPVFPAGYALKNQDYMVDLKEYENIQNELVKASIGSNTKIIFPQPFFPDEKSIPVEANVKVLKCNCGSTAFYLTFDGKVYPCTYLVGTPNAQNYYIGTMQDTIHLLEQWETKSELDDYREGVHTCPSFDILMNFQKSI